MILEQNPDSRSVIAPDGRCIKYGANVLVLFWRFAQPWSCLNCFGAGQEIVPRQFSLSIGTLIGDAYLLAQVAGYCSTLVRFDPGLCDFGKKNRCRVAVPG